MNDAGTLLRIFDNVEVALHGLRKARNDFAKLSRSEYFSFDTLSKLDSQIAYLEALADNIGEIEPMETDD